MRLLAALVLCASPLAAQEPAPETGDAAAPDTPAALEGEPTTTTTTETPPPETPAETPPAPTTTTPAPPTTTPPATTTTTPDPAAASVEVPAGRRVGDPMPLTRREPTLKAHSLMVGVRYGLVGTGPTRFVDDIRFSITDEIELRTTLAPYPAALMARGRFGSQQGEMGAFIVEGGLAYFDAGLRIVEDTGEPSVGVRFHFEGDVGYAKALGDQFAVNAYAHYRARVSFLPDDDQHAAAVDAHLTYDLLPSLAVSTGLGFATTLGTPVRELGVNFVETDRPGLSHLLARDDGLEQSLTLPLTLTYGRVDSFDVDLFCTPRVWPELGIAFGAGLRFRIEPLWN